MLYKIFAIEKSPNICFINIWQAFLLQVIIQNTFQKAQQMNNKHCKCINLILFTSLINFISAVIVFKQPTAFGTMQVQLSTTTGAITPSTFNTFSYANPGFSNITSIGMALCGYDIPTPKAIQFRAQAGFDDQTNSVIIQIFPLNTTRFAFINYHIIFVTEQIQAILFVQNTCLIPPYEPTNSSYAGKSQNYTIVSPFMASSGNKVTAIPYLRSFNNIVYDSFNFVKILSVSMVSGSYQANILLMNNYSYQSEVCLSVLFYWDAQAIKNNLVNASYSANFLLINSSSSTQNLAAVTQQNFTLNNIYGPIFQRKCVLGFQNLKLDSKFRQTLSFNITGNGIYGTISSSNYQVSYSWFCMAQITCQGSFVQYYPIITDCQAICNISDCNTCKTSTSCLQCSDYYYLNQLYRCSRCMPNCKNCTNSTNCFECAPAYFYNTTACTPCSQFCNSCTQGSCKTCAYGYYGSGAVCTKCSNVLNQCINCLTGTYCSLCPTGYYTSTTKGCILCNSTIVSCETCSSASVCLSCSKGTYVSGGTCKTCVYSISSCCSLYVPNCTTCSSTTTCNQCASGFFLMNGNQGCSLCQSSLPNCIACTGTSLCTLCNTNYYLNTSGKCSLCSSVINQCITCVNSTLCQTCQPGFLIVSGSCFNCPIWPTRNLYYLDQNNICQPCQNAVANCINCNQNRQCNQCSDLWYLTQGNCQLCSDHIINCLSCNNATYCTTCINGYFPVKPQSTSCALCNEQVMHCTSCFQNLDSSNNTYTVVCRGCLGEYYLNGTICSPCIQSIPFCETCYNNFQCSYCQQGYFLSSIRTCVTCIQLIGGCDQCLTSSVCLSCSIGYYIVNNYCTQCSMALTNCFSCGFLNSTLTCQSCLPGYYLGSNFTCFSCKNTLNFCSTCSSSYACNTCISGYTLNYNRTCSPCSILMPNCDYCSITTCLKCEDNFILNDYGLCNDCNAYILGCKICTFVINNVTSQNQPNCTECQSTQLLYLIGLIAKCIPCNSSIPNCISCVNLTYCSACSAISFLNDLNTCSLCSLYIPNCLQCNTSSACTNCNANYYLNNNSTCQYCNPLQFGTDGTALLKQLCLYCKYYSGIATCLSCNYGYYAQNNKCLNCVQKLSNCLQCSTSSFCIQCSSGYYLSSDNGQCLECSSNLVYCSRCTELGACLQCQRDCYLNISSNRCVKCTQLSSFCNSCSNTTCQGCADGYYLSGSSSCLSCSDAMINCLLCDNSSVCLLYSNTPSNTTVSTSSAFFTIVTSNVWMYIAIACFALLLLLIIICIIWKKCLRQDQQPKSPPVSQQTKSTTERQLCREDIESNDLGINHAQFCQSCKAKSFQVMHIELLCTECQKKRVKSKDHIIRKVLNEKQVMVRQKSSQQQKGRKASKKYQNQYQREKTLQKHSNLPHQSIYTAQRKKDKASQLIGVSKNLTEIKGSKSHI